MFFTRTIQYPILRDAERSIDILQSFGDLTNLQSTTAVREVCSDVLFKFIITSNRTFSFIHCP